MTTKLVSNPTSHLIEKEVDKFMRKLSRRNRGEKEFIQAVREVAEVVIPFIIDTPKYHNQKILERICEPERVFIFRVPWMDDKGRYQINRGFRIQMNSAIGPYKGGLRLHPSVNLSILKFLAFEQVFKNSLTTLPLGAGKGGADFDPKYRSDNEVMRFCQSYMTELSKYIGANIDIPAGDIGTGSREIGYMFGQYKRINKEFVGVLTGKDFSYGGSLIRPEATGYGCVYFMDEMLKHHNESIEGKKCLVSGSGNVSQYTIKKLLSLGAIPVTVSDSDGVLYAPEGIDQEMWEYLMELKNVRRGRVKEMAEYFGVEYYEGAKPWIIKADLAFPSATQNEIDEEDAHKMAKNGVFAVAEGANMPSTPEAIRIYKENKILYAPGKASNAGGVAVSGLEMAQNSIRYTWTKEEVDQKLKDIMVNIHKNSIEYGQINGIVDYVKGANIAGFVKVADAMMAQGLV
jgi:glutamate dehydrogenase (NADP+)